MNFNLLQNIVHLDKVSKGPKNLYSKLLQHIKMATYWIVHVCRCMSMLVDYYPETNFWVVLN